MAMSGTARRVNQRSENMQYRVNGTEAYAPERAASLGRDAAPYRRIKGSRIGTSSAYVERNRRKALTVNFAYVVFLAVISVATVFMCVHYLQLKSTIKAQIEGNGKLESELVSLRSENDALLENVNNTLDWNHIKDVAINELGMKYATEDQIVWYNTNESGYIRQYAEVPPA